MVTYADGTEARIGDQVDLDGDLATVVDVIDDADGYARSGINEDGLMFDVEPGGYVFQAADTISWDAILFLKRAVD